jgi:putative thioredoxin
MRDQRSTPNCFGNLSLLFDVEGVDMIDSTDATFETDVIERSKEVPVIVDLWAPWCGPCKTLGPILESVIGEHEGKVEGVKIDIDENPGVAQAFQVQSIPMVIAFKDGQAVDGFMGAQGEPAVQEFISKLLPTDEQSALEALIEAGDEQSLIAALELESDNHDAVVTLAEIYATSERGDEALKLLERIPGTPESRRVAALARTGLAEAPSDEVEAKLAELLTRVKGDEDARQEFVDLLEVMGVDNPATAPWRKKLTNALF